MNTAGFQERSAAPALSTGAWPDAAVSLRLEHSPAALARVYSILCTIGLVPTTMSGYAVGPDVLQLDLGFHQVAAGRVDLLLRKLAQMVDCIEIQTAPGG